MALDIHFIAGLPRSGSTLLAGILRQNPRFRASMSSPLHGLLVGLLKSMSGGTDLSEFISNDQRKRIIQAVVDAYYAEVPPGKVIFDTNRGWPAYLPWITELFPRARVLCCLRSPAWILDSIERQLVKSPWEASKIFNYNPAMDLYSRVDFLIKEHMVGPSLRTVRQAWFGDDARLLVGVRYESLTEKPAETLARLYDALGEPSFDHDFNNVIYEEPEYDKAIGLPGFHTVRPRVEPNRRATILPPDIFTQYDECFWEASDQNPRKVMIV